MLIHHTSSHKLEPLKLLPIVRSIARGMLHLHTRRPAILHRDLKLGNLFIGRAGWGGAPAKEGLARLYMALPYSGIDLNLHAG